MAAQAAQEWPPKLGDQAVLELASDWALSNGLVLRPPTSSTEAAYTRPGQSVIHAPYALYPSAFPRKLFQQAMDLQAAYNRLYADVTVDDAFLDKVIGGAVSKVDEFQGRLYDIWKQVKKEGIRQVRLGCPRFDGAIPSFADRNGPRRAAPRTRTVPIRLPRACARRPPAKRAHHQAGRVQHHLGFVCLALDSRRRTAPVR